MRRMCALLIVLVLLWAPVSLAAGAHDEAAPGLNLWEVLEKVVEAVEAFLLGGPEEEPALPPPTTEAGGMIIIQG